jgi:hypothetical protein
MNFTKLTSANRNKLATPLTSSRPDFNPMSASKTIGVSSLKRPILAYQTPSYSRATKTTSNRVINSATLYRGPNIQSSLGNRHNTKGITSVAAIMATPTTTKNSSEMKRISRTVDCARTSVRRSIQTLNNIMSIDAELKTPSLKNSFRRSTFRKYVYIE